MAGKTRNRKKFDRSVDRSRDTHSADHRLLRWPRIRHEEYAYTRKYEVCARDRKYLIFDRGYRLKFLLPRIFANIFLSSEEDVSTNFFERNGGGIFSRGYQVRVARILRNIVCSPGENNLDIGCYNIDLLARRT